MRPDLKFRVWNTRRKRWETAGDFAIACVDSLSNNAEFLECRIDGLLGPSPDEKKNFVVQPSTGLLDKNRKVIFEGDIVTSVERHLCECCPDWQRMIRGEVRFFNGGFKVCSRETGAMDLYDFVFLCSEECCPCGLEIVGNIFENGED